MSCKLKRVIMGFFAILCLCGGCFADASELDQKSQETLLRICKADSLEKLSKIRKLDLDDVHISDINLVISAISLNYFKSLKKLEIDIDDAELDSACVNSLINAINNGSLAKLSKLEISCETIEPQNAEALRTAVENAKEAGRLNKNLDFELDIDD